MRTFHDALPADANRQIHNFNRRLRYQSLDRPKVFAGSDLPTSDFRADAQKQGRTFLEVLNAPPSTASYVEAWCWLNHLTGGVQ
jgi:hypothetical protein